MVHGNKEVFDESDEISIKDLISKIKRITKYLLSKWPLIVVLSLIGSALGVSYSIYKKPVYKGNLTFALQDEKSSGGFSGALGLASQFGIDLGGATGGGEFSGDNLLVLMKSRAVVEKALLTSVSIKGRNQTLADLYIDFNGLRKKWENTHLQNIHFLPESNRAKFTLSQDSLLGVFNQSLLKNNLTVDKVDKKSSIILIGISSTNEIFSKYFAEALVNVVSEYYIQSKTKKGRKNVAILQHQTDSVRQILNSGIAGVATSVNANPNPLIRSLIVPSQRKTVDVQTNTAILSELVKNLALAKMSLLQETPLIQIIDKPILPLENNKVSVFTGFIVGGLIAFFMTILSLIIKNIYQSVMS